MKETTRLATTIETRCFFTSMSPTLASKASTGSSNKYRVGAIT